MNEKITVDEMDLIQNQGHKVHVGEAEYYYIPYYFKASKDGIEKFAFEELPIEVQKRIPHRNKEVEINIENLNIGDEDVDFDEN